MANLSEPHEKQLVEFEYVSLLMHFLQAPEFVLMDIMFIQRISEPGVHTSDFERDLHGFNDDLPIHENNSNQNAHYLKCSAVAPRIRSTTR